MSDSGRDELVFLPLGGSNEIGMNFNLYGFGPPEDRKWIVVDLGVTFGDQTTPGVEVILPDPTFIESFRDDILGIVLTHAHEDHIGAVPWLWARLRAPLYATPFTAFLVREKLRDAGLLDEVSITEVPLDGSLRLGPFEITLITLTHSTPEPNGLAIRTPRSESLFCRLRIGISLPGITREEKITESPCPRLTCGWVPSAIRDSAARASPWLPVHR